MYIIPLPTRPPIPLLPYFVLFNSSFISSRLFLSVKAILTAIIAGSKAWIFTLLGLLAKLAPLFIISS